MPWEMSSSHPMPYDSAATHVSNFPQNFPARHLQARRSFFIFVYHATVVPCFLFGLLCVIRLFAAAGKERSVLWFYQRMETLLFPPSCFYRTRCYRIRGMSCSYTSSIFTRSMGGCSQGPSVLPLRPGHVTSTCSIVSRPTRCLKSWRTDIAEDLVIPVIQNEIEFI